MDERTQEARKMLRGVRRIELDTMMSKKPDLGEEDPTDVAAIEDTRTNLGDKKLKNALVAMPVTEAPTPNKALACVPEVALIVIVLVLPVEADVIFKKLPSTTIVAPAIVIPLAADAKSPKLACNATATSVPSAITTLGMSGDLTNSAGNILFTKSGDQLITKSGSGDLKISGGAAVCMEDWCFTASAAARWTTTNCATW